MDGEEFIGFDTDERRGTDQLSRPARLGVMNGRRDSVGFQIVSGLSRMQDNIRSIRQQRYELDKQRMVDDLEMQGAQTKLKLLEIENPEAAAAAKQEFTLFKKNKVAQNDYMKFAKAKEEREATKEQRAMQQKAVETLEFLSQNEAPLKEAEEMWGLVPSLGPNGLTLTQKKTAQDYDIKIRAEAYKSAKDEFGEVTQDRFDRALEMLRGSAAPVSTGTPAASSLPKNKAPKDGQRAKLADGKVIAYNAKTRKWAAV